MKKNYNATVILGTQYGDEGKGKLVDLVSSKADVVCRAQGGNNAGHTIWVKKKKIVTHLVPSAILRSKCKVGLGSGMVIDPLALFEELEGLQGHGTKLTAQRLSIDPRAHVILPYHKLMDAKREEGATKIGTTKRGIGPTYASRAYREAPRIGDFVEDPTFKEFFSANPELKEGFTAEVAKEFAKIAEFIKPFVADVAQICNTALDKDKHVLIEGAQGAMLDISYGSYPFVTSSSLFASACLGNLGIAPWKTARIIGVVKAYATRVGNGPFVGELQGTLENVLREKGHEFGSTTGRPRRVGWLDLVALNYFITLNGITHLALMKSDVLCGFEDVGLVVGYRNKQTGKVVSQWPTTNTEWNAIEPIVEFHRGWNSLMSKNGTLEKNFKDFISRIKDFTKTPIAYVSTGADRDAGKWLSKLF